jgi:tetratricopeptide (TPR) repeat protein
MNLAAIYNARHEWTEAEAACRRGLARNADNAMLLNQIGLALWQDGRRAEGQTAWRRSVRLDPTDLTARVNLAASLYQLGDIQAVREQLLVGLSSNEDSRVSNPDMQALYVAHFKLGDIYQMQGRWQAAAQEYEHVLQIKPDLSAAHAQLASVRAHLASSQTNGPVIPR